MDLGRALELRPELAGAGVEAPTVGGRDRAVQRVAQELVPEVVQPAQAGRVQDELVDELLERPLDRLGRDVHDPGQDSGTKQRPMTAPARAVACASGESWAIRAMTASSIVSGTFASRIAAPSERASALSAPEQLLDVERDAIGPLVDGRRDVARGRQAGVEQERRDQGGLALRRAAPAGPPRRCAG